jgi:peptide/nickel transport system substrate-binding protein
VRALDRVLLSGDSVVPLYHLPRQWVAYWRQLKRPDTTPLYGYRIDSWWIEPSQPQGEQAEGPTLKPR